MWLPALAPTRQRLGESGRQSDSLDEAGRWSTPLWTYAVLAVGIYSRAAADRLGVTVGEIAQRTHGNTGSRPPRLLKGAYGVAPAMAQAPPLTSHNARKNPAARRTGPRCERRRGSDNP